eukprot:828502-Rhodomonas_salina.2
MCTLAVPPDTRRRSGGRTRVRGAQAWSATPKAALQTPSAGPPYPGTTAGARGLPLPLSGSRTAS